MTDPAGGAGYDDRHDLIRHDLIHLDHDEATIWSGIRWFVAVGSFCIVVGGLVAAVTGPTGFEDGSWVAAYLVLVGGVAQITLGVGQQLVGASAPRPGVLWTELVGWNVGMVATVGGTLASEPLLTTVGGIATAVALVSFLTVRTGRPSKTRIRQADVVNIGYRGMAAFVLVSIPVGVSLAWFRHG